MKLTPRSIARLSAAMESASDCAPHWPPSAQAPKPISEQEIPVLPKERYFMGELVREMLLDLRLEKPHRLAQVVHAVHAVLDRDPGIEPDRIQDGEDPVVVVHPAADDPVRESVRF